MEIMKLSPAGKDYIWGGTRLKEEYGKDLPLSPLAETWECSVHPDGLSTVRGGAYDGETLADVLSAHPEYLGKRNKGDGSQPPLVKFIDAREALSVQVHPDDAYALAHEGQRGKSEMWYVMDAVRGAYIFCGFSRPVTRGILENAVKYGGMEKYLRKIYVRPGDVFYIPAGRVHAIGAGVMIAEIQEPSNVTYRVYDYNRTDSDGMRRELRVDRALSVMDMSPSPVIRRPGGASYYRRGYVRETLCRCRYFTVDRIVSESEFAVYAGKESYTVLLCLEGGARITSPGTGRENPDIVKGDCLFIPAGTGTVRAEGRATCLAVRQ